MYMYCLQEFYESLRSNCLLSDEQLHAVFLNLPELMSVSSYFIKRLHATTGLDRPDLPPDHKVIIYTLFRIKQHRHTIQNTLTRNY